MHQAHHLTHHRQQTHHLHLHHHHHHHRHHQTALLHLQPRCLTCWRMLHSPEDGWTWMVLLLDQQLPPLALQAVRDIAIKAPIRYCAVIL